MNVSNEVNLNQILKIFTTRWKYLVILALLFLLMALTKHKIFPSYPGTGKLMIKDFRNSQMQSLIGHVAGAGAEVQISDNKGDDLPTRAETILDTHDFYFKVANKLFELKNAGTNPEINTFFEKYKSKTSDPEYLHLIANELSSIISFVPSKSDILVVNLKTNNRELTVTITNTALVTAQDNLIERELNDLNRAENYIQDEIETVRNRLDNIENSTVRKMQKTQVLAVDMEKGETAKYISELRNNINTTRIAYSNNLGKIKELQNKLSLMPIRNLGVISKFNEYSQIKILENENSDLDLALKTQNKYLKNFEEQKNGLVPVQYELEKMNVNHEFEYKIFTSLHDSLARIGLQKTYVKNKVEILESERLSHVHSSPSLIILVLLALMLSQVLGIFSIYILELFKT
jgi:uncharacterized protein involved in exopolysaccharide biosynthesis